MAPPRKTIPVSESVTPTQILSTHISKSAKELGKEKLQELIKESGDKYIETDGIVDVNGNKLPEPLTKEEVRDAKINIINSDISE